MQENTPDVAPVALFGLTGDALEASFLEAYARQGVEVWVPHPLRHPDRLVEHLQSSRVLVFVITDGLRGAEAMELLAGFAAAGVKDTDRDVLVSVPDPLTDEAAAEEAMRAHSLIHAFFAALGLPNVRLLDSLNEVLEESVRLAHRPSNS